MSCTSASRERVRRLKSVDLPTLGRPTRTTVGFIELAARRPRGAAPQKRTNETVPPAVCTRSPDGVGTIALIARAVGREPADDGAVVLREHVQVAQRIAHHDLAVDDDRHGEPAAQQLVLLPARGAAVAVERVHVVLVVRRRRRSCRRGRARWRSRSRASTGCCRPGCRSRRPCPGSAAAQMCPPSMTGSPATSATRSSSVEPRGRLTVTSHVSLPSSRSRAMSLPLG